MNTVILSQVLAALFCILLVFTVAYYLGYRRNLHKFEALNAHDRAEMLTIERALKQFWDHEKEKLEQEKEELKRHINFLETRLDQYRRKAAGIGMMGLRKSKLADMFVTLLIENETLEEKLFLQNLKLKQERDEFLESEMRNISYKRILLSDLINQAEVRREMERAVSDRGRWKKLEIKNKHLEPLTSGMMEEDAETA